MKRRGTEKGERKIMEGEERRGRGRTGSEEGERRGEEVRGEVFMDRLS